MSYEKGGILIAILEVKGIEKIYTAKFGGNHIKALSNVAFSVEDGEYAAIMGESGSGKTTLLRQYRTKTVRKMRSQIFCQMKQKTQLILCVSARLFVKNDGKDASRLRAEP